MNLQQLGALKDVYTMLFKTGDREYMNHLNTLFDKDNYLSKVTYMFYFLSLKYGKDKVSLLKTRLYLNTTIEVNYLQLLEKLERFQVILDYVTHTKFKVTNYKGDELFEGTLFNSLCFILDNEQKNLIKLNLVPIF